MTRYTDTDELKQHIASFTGMFTDEGFMVDLQAVLSAIDFASTADVVEVLRCKDCYWSRNHRKLYGEDVCDCAKWPSNDVHRVKALDDYCSDAYKRSEDE